MKQTELQAQFDGLPVLAEVESGAQQDQLLDLFKHPGFSVLCSLLLGARQAQYAALANAPLGSAEASWRAGVTQGTIKGIELVFDTALEHTVPERAEQGASR